MWITPEDRTAKRKPPNYTCCSKQLKGQSPQRDAQFNIAGNIFFDLKGLKPQTISFDSPTVL